MDRFYKSKLTKLDESTKKDFQPSPTVSHFGEIESLQGAGVAYFCDRWFMILNREEELHSQHFPWMEDSQFVLHCSNILTQLVQIANVASVAPDRIEFHFVYNSSRTRLTSQILCENTSKAMKLLVTQRTTCYISPILYISVKIKKVKNLELLLNANDGLCEKAICRESSSVYFNLQQLQWVNKITNILLY